jgi:hypothetical protein
MNRKAKNNRRNKKKPRGKKKTPVAGDEVPIPAGSLAQAQEEAPPVKKELVVELHDNKDRERECEHECEFTFRLEVHPESALWPVSAEIKLTTPQFDPVTNRPAMMVNGLNWEGYGVLRVVSWKGEVMWERTLRPRDSGWDVDESKLAYAFQIKYVEGRIRAVKVNFPNAGRLRAALITHVVQCAGVPRPFSADRFASLAGVGEIHGAIETLLNV